jgi:uncharacterized protein (DUF362 family)/ferredoxin
VPTRVSIVKIKQSIDEALLEAVDLVGGLEVNPGEKLLIKPNMSCGKPSGSGLVTNVDVVAAVVRFVQEKGATALVGDLPIVGWDPEETYQIIGIREAVTKAGGTFVDLAKEDMIRIKLPMGKKLKKITLTKLILDVDGIINVPVLKTHFMTGHTGAIKNLKGLTEQTQRTRMHVLGLFAPIVDLFEHLRPLVRFNIVDGTTAADAVRPAGPYKGPTAGNPVEMNILLAGKDAFAIDATIAQIFGFKPEKLSLLNEAYERKLGEFENIEVLGDAAETFKKRQRSKIGRLFAWLERHAWSSRLNPVTHRIVRRFWGSEVVSRRTALREQNSTIAEGLIEFTEACTNCGLCEKACKFQAILMEEGTPHYYPNRCVRCWICAEACPEAAIVIKSQQVQSVVN